MDATIKERTENIPYKRGIGAGEGPSYTHLYIPCVYSLSLPNSELSGFR